ncbi:MAG: anhydro-N-acetylmuramic acid kinase, partial [Bacteroidales bacterium]|nr:anhydro-N-acetylmuramic acid kinase [Bacteroidales bacterium]
MIKKTNVIGLMSGSSLDGIDLVDVDFWHDGKWHFKIVAKDNYDYDDYWKQRLSDAFYYDQNQLKDIDYKYKNGDNYSKSIFINKIIKEMKKIIETKMGLIAE